MSIRLRNSTGAVRASSHRLTVRRKVVTAILCIMHQSGKLPRLCGSDLVGKALPTNVRWLRNHGLLCTYSDITTREQFLEVLKAYHTKRAHYSLMFVPSTKGWYHAPGENGQLDPVVDWQGYW